MDKPKQFSLFDESPQIEVVVPSVALSSEPVWEFKFLPHMDFIGREYITGYIFRLADLEAQSGIYSTPVFTALLQGLNQLSHQKKAWRERSFSIFAGDCGRYERFFIGFGIGQSETDGAIYNFLGSCLEKVKGYECFDSGSSDDFIPVFRYDAGHVIEYNDEGLEGTSYIDTPDFYGSGLKIHRRIYRSAEDVGSEKSIYGKLKRDSI